jgi:hypothetical protein
MLFRAVTECIIELIEKKQKKMDYNDELLLQAAAHLVKSTGAG